MNLNIFTTSKIFKIIDTQTTSIEKNHHSYCIQYHCKLIDDYNLYQNKYAKKLQEEHSIKYAKKFKASREILKEL